MTLQGALRSRGGGLAGRVMASTGPWPVGRTLRALGALAAAVSVAAWAVSAHPRMGGLLEMPALLGLVILVTALVAGRARLLPLALAPIGLAVAVAVVALSPPAVTVAALGGGIVAAHELARWSFERRVDPPAEGATELRRWLHLGAVLGLGWLVGVGAVALAAGRIDLAVWQSVLAALGAVVVAAVVAVAARARARSGDPEQRQRSSAVFRQDR